MEDRTVDEAIAIAKENLSGIAKEIKDGVFVFVDDTDGTYQGIMPPSDDKPLPTPYVRLGKKWWKSPALINGIPADEYMRQHAAAHEERIVDARWGTGNLNMEDAKRLYDEMRGEI